SPNAQTLALTPFPYPLIFVTELEYSSAKDPSYTQAQLQKLADTEMALEQAFERWEELENIKNGIC
ncbi:hypothetical protein NUS66_11100, partial [Glaesserella parasuis]|nr:hypothetical protein [Glaesserella parasuis]